VITDVMVDLETLSLSPNCAITQIGAVAFDLEGLVLPAEFSQYISEFTPECDVDPKTFAWWLGQKSSGTLAAGILGENATDLAGALWAFEDWYQLFPNVQRIWSHGAATDLTWLVCAYERIGLKAPWHYRAPRDTRTLFDLVGGAPDRAECGYNESEAHDALQDCRVQARQVQEAYRMLARVGVGVKP
jgi:hypothetical protein